jgi:hypothetical protein
MHACGTMQAHRPWDLALSSLSMLSGSVCFQIFDGKIQQDRSPDEREFTTPISLIFGKNSLKYSKPSRQERNVELGATNAGSITS